ncbi:MAG: DUF4179 domain-containing protein [Paenibacillus sp.]|nr:DUF4179 domain-containing protein [Paenibacillus sp.]
MAEPEEKLIEDYFHNMSTKVDEVPDIKLETAIHNGILRGSHKRPSVRRGFTIAVLATLAAALFVIVPWIQARTEPERAQLPPKSWGELEVFRPIIKNISLKSALDAGMVQTIGVSSEEKDGYIFTLNGVVADNKGMIALYTLQNNTQHDVLLHGMSIDNARSNSRSSQTNFFIESGYHWRPGVNHIVIRYLRDKEQEGLEELEELVANMIVTPDTPEAMLSSSTKYRTSLSIPFKLETDRIQQNSRTIIVNRNLKIAGQQIVVQKAYIAPTGIYVDIKYHKDNTMNINSLFAPKIILGKGKSAEVLSVSESGTRTLIFYNDNMNKDSRMTLEVEGIDALEKSKRELIINTETRTIINAPDNRLTISDEKTVEKDGILALTLFTPKEEGKEEGEERLISGMLVDDNFVDGTGSGHFMSYRPDHFTYTTEGEHHQDETGDKVTYFYNVGSEKLPQPLTFILRGYSNPIQETDRVRIR